MNEGVKILIERLKTNPEDFEYRAEPKKPYGMKQGRFYWVTEQIQDYLTLGSNHMYLTLLMKDDLDALVNAYKEKHQQEFTDRVMRDLFKEEEESVVGPTIAGGWLPQQGLIAKGQNATWSDPRLAMQQAQNAQQAHITHLRQHEKALSGLTSVSNGLSGGLTGGLLGKLFK